MAKLTQSTVSRLLGSEYQISEKGIRCVLGEGHTTNLITKAGVRRILRDAKKESGAFVNLVCSCGANVVAYNAVKTEKGELKVGCTTFSKTMVSRFEEWANE